MDVNEFLEIFESLPSFPGIKANNTVYKWWDNQGSVSGIKVLGFRCGCPNGELDILGARVESRKDGISRRGSPPCVREVQNAKKRGIKAIKKSQKRRSIRF